jgi:hypothetical protein
MDYNNFINEMKGVPGFIAEYSFIGMRDRLLQ